MAEEHDAKEALNPDRAMSEQAILKRKEREERKARGKTNPPEPSQGILVSNESLSTSLADESVPDPADSHPESSQTARLHGSDVTIPRHSITPYTVHVPGTSSTFEWYALPTHSFTTLAAARDAGIWDYPETPIQRARCGVFRDLWEQGYFMGGGIKFGGEYLVYPGMFPPLIFLRKKRKRIVRHIAPGLISVVLEERLRYSRSLRVLLCLRYSDLFLLRHPFVIRGSVTIPLPLCRIRYRVSYGPSSANGDRCSWSARNRHKEGSHVMRVGRGQEGRNILLHRVVGIWMRTRSVRPNHPSHRAVVRKKRHCIAYPLTNDSGGIPRVLRSA